MKNKAIIFTLLSSTLVLAGCGQNGPLYLQAPTDANTTSGVHQQHINTNESSATKQNQHRITPSNTTLNASDKT